MDRGVVDRDVEPPKPLADGGESRNDGPLIRHVRREMRVVGRSDRRSRSSTEAHDVKVAGNEMLRQVAPNATAGTGDQDDRLVRHAVAPRTESRCTRPRSAPW